MSSINFRCAWAHQQPCAPVFGNHKRFKRVVCSRCVYVTRELSRTIRSLEQVRDSYQNGNVLLSDLHTSEVHVTARCKDEWCSDKQRCSLCVILWQDQSVIVPVRKCKICNCAFPFRSAEEEDGGDGRRLRWGLCGRFIGRRVGSWTVGRTACHTALKIIGRNDLRVRSTRSTSAKRKIIGRHDIPKGKR